MSDYKAKFLANDALCLILAPLVVLKFLVGYYFNAVALP
jgi:hypothetical protein